mmetsp:Transcript_31096/g.50184  ORF Transcript_31096/g.50184 Transcript_31096/m.50184 type:complete len:140 (-) Transcript_31096:204-623(-)
MTEAFLNQTHATMALPENKERVAALVAKYAAPVTEFPSDWDTALMNVYRADLGARDDDSVLTGRQLLATARKSGAAFCVVSGDDDRVVPVKASQRVAELLGVSEGAQVMQDTGHLPMDERPQQLAESLLAFIRKTDASQ